MANCVKHMVRSRYTTNWNQIRLDLITFFSEIPEQLKISIFLQTALAAVTYLAEGLAAVWS
jgi:hypothetical protein